MLTQVIAQGGVGVDFIIGCRDVWKDERIRFIRVQEIASHVAEIGIMRLLINGIEKLFFQREEFRLLRVLIHAQFGLLHGTTLLMIFHGAE